MTPTTSYLSHFLRFLVAGSYENGLHCMGWGRKLMNILVVYDSVFGNTEKVALAIGIALHAKVLRVGEVKLEQLRNLDALIVGSPTQAFQPLKSVKVFIKNLPAGELKGVRIAAFDTRMDVKEVNNRLLTILQKLFGYAAEPITTLLIKKGGTQALTPAGFIVSGKEGPMKAGELERAIEWAKHIGS
jgi:flavodoxin I